MVTIQGEYQGDLHCAATHGPSGSTLTTDAPKDNQGRGEAFSPTDLVATALATCVCTIMAITARTRGVELAGLTWTITKEMSSQPPRRIARLHLTLHLPPAAKAMPLEILERAAHACPVHQSLSPEIEKVIVFHQRD
jgi:putative redox protein